ncbi:MAG: 50S ribosomal protein L13 [Candidatus Peribacteraceae bacterium]|nr:50S ribosomal protein L13 [Candidatus Peribacteraceae bacterium]MBP9850597.1 50S ribosomal protein L13 [Candidatus Peribacteraceae bacterium]
MKTSFPKQAAPKWFILDATDKVLGRVSTEIANVLRGRYKPSFVPHMRCGDHVIVINAEKIKLTGSKMAQKKYFRHAGYLGHLRETPIEDMLAKHPERIIEHAVKGMLPKNATRPHTLKQLHVFAGPAHDHEAQQPVTFPLSI